MMLRLIQDMSDRWKSLHELLLALVLGSMLPSAAWAIEMEALRALREFWAHQKTTFAGWIGDASDVGFVPVLPPDSSLWTPGSLLRVTKDRGLVHAGSRETFLRSVPIIGKARSDSSVIGQLTVGEGGFPLSSLPGILEGLGVFAGGTPEVERELPGLLEQRGLRRVVVAFPDAQIHRLGDLDLAIHLQRAPEEVRKLATNPEIHIITSAVFVRTIQLRFDLHRPDAVFRATVERLLGTGWSWRADGTAERRGQGLYVAIQTARHGEPGAEGGLGALMDTTEETRNIFNQTLVSGRSVGMPSIQRPLRPAQHATIGGPR
jgi:hypothetical protein